ncbi:MAG TPA: hypothetical protein VFS23_13800 [Vicinamibacterales bacterium]|nr:hypothetical protein [Vicinamibacterales bacterium]
MTALRLGVVFAFMVLGASVYAQWPDHKSAGTPRLPDGSPNLSGPVPRHPNGKPDFAGVWDVVADMVNPSHGRERSKYVYNIAADLPGGAPFQPWAKELYEQRQKAEGRGAPTERCLPHGIPDAMLTHTLPFKIVQTPGLTIILFEEFNNWRQVFTDGRKLPTDPQPTWLGYSVGSWDGDTFVIQTAGFNDKSWLDAGGTPHTEALKTTERLRRTDFGHMEIEFTFDDPKTFTQPWSTTVKFNLLADTDLLEFHCDNEKWAERPRP